MHKMIHLQALLALTTIFINLVMIKQNPAPTLEITVQEVLLILRMISLTYSDHHRSKWLYNFFIGILFLLQRYRWITHIMNSEPYLHSSKKVVRLHHITSFNSLLSQCMTSTSSAPSIGQFWPPNTQIHVTLSLYDPQKREKKIQIDIRDVLNKPRMNDKLTEI